VKRTNCFLFVLLFAATGTYAQEEEEEARPTFSVPEPTRKSGAAPGTPQGTYIITQVDYRLTTKETDRFSQALPELTAFLSNSTDLEAKVRWNERTLSDPAIMHALLLYMTGNEATFQITDIEKKQLSEYLKAGGLLFGEDVRTPSRFGRVRGAGVAGTPFDRQFKALIKDPAVLGSQGSRWLKVRKEHPVYSAYFDFLDGPPLAATTRGGNVFDLEMLQVRGRVAVIFSDLNISWFWGNVEDGSRLRGLQFGANLIVFALTQKMAIRH
jgi:hypothetical protein